MLVTIVQAAFAILDAYIALFLFSCYTWHEQYQQLVLHNTVV